jgi:hypothetical protein
VRSGELPQEQKPRRAKHAGPDRVSGLLCAAWLAASGAVLVLLGGMVRDQMYQGTAAGLAPLSVLDHAPPDD